MNYFKIQKSSISNGTGFRIVLWVAGCQHHCSGCQNPETWDCNAGKPFMEKDEKILLKNLEPDYIDGITFSGGDPLFKGNQKKVLELIKKIKKSFPNKSIWLYTGDTLKIEDFHDSSIKSQIINNVDIVVDGEFMIEKKALDIGFRGSSNQRIIDIKQTKIKNNIVQLK